MTPAREKVLREIAARVAVLRVDHPTRVAIDGVTASGKTALADELAALLREDRTVVRLSMDDYHRNEVERHRRGRYSPEGYYHDAFDYPRFLVPLSNLAIPTDAIVLVDGVFLLRPELNEAWDYRVFIEVELGVAYERGIERDASWMGGEAEARRRYNLRYIPGERLYLDEVRPIGLADAVVENTEPASPLLRFPADD
jgi:uridine kinase